MARHDESESGGIDDETGGTDGATGAKDEPTGLGRRSYLRLSGAAAAAAASSALVGSASAATVDLGSEGLAAGDVIDSYLETHFVSGNDVTIPPGEYVWNGGGLGGRIQDASLVGEGDVVLRISDGSTKKPSVLATGGEVLVKNITVTGRGGHGRIRADAYGSAHVIFENFDQPDGCVDRGSAIGFYVGKEHSGTATFRDCVVQNFANNGIYASSPGLSGGDGAVHVIGGLYRNNNIANVRVGSTGSTVRDCVIVHDGAAPRYENGARNQRGLWVREPGRSIAIENCDLSHTYGGANAPLMIQARGGGGGGEVRNTRVRNDVGDEPAIFLATGDWSGDAIHVTGSGDLSVPSHFTNVCRGSGCDAPRTTARDPSELDGSGSTGGSGRPSDHTLELVSPGHFEYTFTTTGPIARVTTAGDMSAEFNNDSLTRNGDGTYTASGLTGNGFGDTFVFDGELASFDVGADSSAEFSVVLDNQDVTDTLVGDRGGDTGPDVEGRLFELVSPGHFAYSFRVEGDVARVTDNGRNSAEFNNDTITDNGDGTVTVAGLTGNGYGDAYDVRGTFVEFASETAVTDRELYLDGEPVTAVEIARPNRIVLEGPGDGTTASYEFEVSGRVVQSEGLGAAETTETVDGTHVTGQVGDDRDGFRFSGNLVSLGVDGDATVNVVDTD